MEENSSQTRLPDGQVIIYQTESGETKLDVTFSDETVWLTQLQMAELFGKSKKTISEHITNIFREVQIRMTYNMFGSEAVLMFLQYITDICKYIYLK